jgi:WD40 repeat protein
MPSGHSRYPFLALLDEALRRDAQFIDRHPTTLFQCLWSSCWWYDCPEAADLYEPPDDGDVSPPGRCGPKLHRLLEWWRDVKRGWTDGFRWLRLLQPPPVALGSAISAVLDAHIPITGIAVSPDGQRIAGACYHHAVRVWDVASLVELSCLRQHEYGALAVAYSPDGRQLAVAPSNGPVRVWDVAAGSLLKELPWEADCLAYSPDGRWLACGSYLLDTVSWTELRSWPRSTPSLACLTFSPDGGLLVGGQADGTVRVWDSQSRVERCCLRGHEKGVLGAVVSAAGDRVVSLGADGTVRVWDIESGHEVRQFRCPVPDAIHVGFPLSGWLALSPDGRHLLAPSVGSGAGIWDLESGTEVRQLVGHESAVTCVAHLPGGRYAATGSVDGTVRIWDLSRTSRHRQLKHHQLTGAQFTADGRYLMSRSGVWGVREGRYLDEAEAREAHQLPLLDPLFEGSTEAPYRCFSGEVEAAEGRSSQTGEPVAWLPGQPDGSITTHPSDQLWVVSPGNGSCYLVCLEAA